MSRFGIKVDKQFFNFAAAHFLLFPDGGRETLHGHNYLVQVEAEGALGPGGLVVDFSLFKPIVKSLCDGLDHRMLLPAEAESLDIREGAEEIEVHHEGERFVFPRRDVLLLPLPNTSSEELARHFGQRLRQRVQTEIPGVQLERIRVTVQESPGQAAWCEEGLSSR